MRIQSTQNSLGLMRGRRTIASISFRWQTGKWVGYELYRGKTGSFFSFHFGVPHTHSTTMVFIYWR